MKPRQKRLAFIVAGVAILATAIGLILYALQNNVSLYFTPTQIYNKEAPEGRNFRIGGMVVENSVEREKDGLTVRFEVTDTAKSMPVVYKGILPDLFKEGKGVVAHGKIGEGYIFVADEVLAKHDENYNAAEVVNALEMAKKSKESSEPAPSEYQVPATK